MLSGYNLLQSADGGGSSNPQSLAANVSKIGSNASLDVQFKSGALLRLQVNPTVTVEGSPTIISVNGSFTYFNGSGVANTPVNITIYPQNKPDRLIYSVSAFTDFSGNYVYALRNLSLPNGNYYISAKPIDSRYSLFARTGLIVYPAPASTLAKSLNDLPQTVNGVLTTTGTIFGAIVTTIGALIAVPRLIVAKKQRHNLVECLIKLANTHSSLHKDKEERLKELESINTEIIRMLDNGKINESQYQMLADKVSKSMEMINAINETEGKK
jgi:soluble P-type ATPase